MKKIVGILLTVAMAFSIPVAAEEAVFPDKEGVIEKVTLANDFWQSKPRAMHAAYGNALYHMGNLAVYELTGKEEYLSFGKAWAEQNRWTCQEDTPEEANETAPNNQLCCYSYIRLSELLGDESVLETVKKTMEYNVTMGNKPFWGSPDYLMKGGVVFAAMGKKYQDSRYFDRFYEFYQDEKVTRKLYDPEEGFWYRKKEHFYPDAKAGNGKKVFYGRISGWVLALYPTLLECLPLDDGHRVEYIEDYQKLASAFAAAQDEDGLWRSSLLCKEDYPNPESSASAFAVYGLAWGVNNGYLDQSYLPVITKGWEGLTTLCLQENGLFGYVQKTGSEPGPAQANETYDVGVGAFLLAGSQVARLGDNAFRQGEKKDIHVFVNGGKLTFDAPPRIVEGRTLVPMRAIFEALGATVEWNEETRQVTASKDGINISLTIDNAQAFVNGQEAALEVPAAIYEGRTFVPLRFVAESMEAAVDWYGETNTVVIVPKTLGT